MSSLTVVSIMEVPRRLHPPTLTLTLANAASAPPCAIGPKQKSSRRNGMRQRSRLEKHGGPEEEEEEAAPEEKVPSEEDLLEETSQLLDISPARHSRLSSEDSVSEETLESEEVLEEEVRRKSEEEKAAAKEREAQRQQMSVEELVQSERSYLRMLELSTGTIRSSLQKLQVGGGRLGLFQGRNRKELTWKESFLLQDHLIQNRDQSDLVI